MLVGSSHVCTNGYFSHPSASVKRPAPPFIVENDVEAWKHHLLVAHFSSIWS